MESPFGPLLALSAHMAAQRERVDELRSDLITVLELGSFGSPSFDLRELLKNEGQQASAMVASLLVVALSDPVLLGHASALLADRLYGIGVPRNVSDHAAPGPFAAFGVLVALTRKPPSEQGWAEVLWSPENGACELQDAVLLGLLTSPTDIERMAAGFGGDEPVLVEGLHAVQVVRALLAAPAAAGPLPDRLHRRFHEALFLRGWRRHAARRAGRASAAEDGDVALPGWLTWDGDDPVPGGLVAAQIEWLCAARRSRPASGLRALASARGAVEECVAGCHDARMKKWGEQEFAEWGRR